MKSMAQRLVTTPGAAADLNIKNLASRPGWAGIASAKFVETYQSRSGTTRDAKATR
jgi:uncharacterized protein YukE